MVEDIQELLDLREEEEKEFKVIAANFHRNMDKFDEEIDRMRDECDHVYEESETHPFFGFEESECTLCGLYKVTG